MGVPTSILRFSDYLQRHGLQATLGRAGLALRRTLFSSCRVILYCDLTTQNLRVPDLPSTCKVERKKREDELSQEELQHMISFWNPKLARRNIQERFGLGASLWLIKFEERLAGYGWTLRGRTVEPHYFPLGEQDVQFLDFHVFPKYRGRAIDWLLMTYILSTLAAEGSERAFGEAAEWNRASLSSFAMARFQRLGWARKLTILGHTIVWWCQRKEPSTDTSSKSRVWAKKERLRIPNVRPDVPNS